MPDADSRRLGYLCPGTGCNRVFPSRKGLTSHQRHCTFCNSEESDEELGEPDFHERAKAARTTNHDRKRERRSEARSNGDDSNGDESNGDDMIDSDTSDSGSEKSPRDLAIIDATQADMISEQHRFCNLFTDMRLKHASNSMVDIVKSSFRSLLTVIHARVARAVHNAAAVGNFQSIQDCISPIQAALASVMTTHRESMVRDVLVPAVKPVARTLGKRTFTDTLAGGRVVTTSHVDVCYDMPFEEVLEALLEGNKDVYHDVISSYQRWQHQHQQCAGDGDSVVLRDLNQGLAFQLHPMLNAEAMQGTDAALVLALGFYGDGVTIACPIGPRHSNSMVELYYWFMINVQPDHRLSLHNIQLATIALTEDVKRYGTQLVISGGDPDGSFQHSTSFGAVMHRLNAGIRLTIPNPLRSEGHASPLAEVLTKGWCPLIIADNPASAAMLGMKASVAATCFCRACDARKECLLCDDEADEDDDVDEEEHRYAGLKRSPNSFLPWMKIQDGDHRGSGGGGGGGVGGGVGGGGVIGGGGAAGGGGGAAGGGGGGGAGGGVGSAEAVATEAARVADEAARVAEAAAADSAAYPEDTLKAMLANTTRVRAAKAAEEAAISLQLLNDLKVRMDVGIRVNPALANLWALDGTADKAGAAASADGAHTPAGGTGGVHAGSVAGVTGGGNAGGIGDGGAAPFDSGDEEGKEDLQCADDHMRKDYDPSRKGARQLYNLRSMSQWIAAKAKYDAATSQKERDAVLKEYGAQNFREGTFFPCWDFWGAPQDLMHVELEGLLKDELYLVLFEMAKHGWISCKEFNKAKEKHRWPGGARLCDLKPEHFQGQTGGKPKRNYKSLPFSAHDMLLLVVDSIVLLRPFVKDWNADFWQCWLLHVEYFTLLLSDAFSLSDVRHLDSLIYRHQMLFLSIEDYFHFWVSGLLHTTASLMTQPVHLSH